MKNRIGIRRENEDISERRAPFTPQQVAELIREYGVEVAVEPSSDRVFPDEEYRKAGAIISQDLSGCNIIFGVKEIPAGELLPKQTYCYFSHTIKGQAYNMPMLKRILDLRATLLDYEKVTNGSGKRLIFFGPFAGYAGMIDSLWVLGQRLKWEGLETPLQSVQQAFHYESLQDAKNAVRRSGQKIAEQGLPQSLAPLMVGFTGYGQVSRGAQEIFDELPHEEIEPSKLQAFMEAGNFSDRLLYKVVFKESDMVRPAQPDREFDLAEYYRFPERFTGIFGNYLPHLTVLVNGIYWEPRYPRLVTKDYLRKRYSEGRAERLRVISDISCDIEGSIECNLKATSSQNPVYVYEPLTGQAIDGWEGNGPVVLAVDKLPTELPREASARFGEALMPFVPELARADFEAPFESLNISPEFQRAVIAHDGRLNPDYKYLEKFIK